MAYTSPSITIMLLLHVRTSRISGAHFGRMTRAALPSQPCFNHTSPGGLPWLKSACDKETGPRLVSTLRRSVSKEEKCLSTFCPELCSASASLQPLGRYPAQPCRSSAAHLTSYRLAARAKGRARATRVTLTAATITTIITTITANTTTTVSTTDTDTATGLAARLAVLWPVRSGTARNSNPAERARALMETARIRRRSCDGAVAWQFPRQRPARRGSPVTPPWIAGLLF